MCVDDAGERLNVNADSAATAVAQSLGAEKLVFLSDINGVRRCKDDPNSLIQSLGAAEAQRLIDSGAIEDGMIPKGRGMPRNAGPRRPKSTYHRR